MQERAKTHMTTFRSLDSYRRVVIATMLLPGSLMTTFAQSPMKTTSFEVASITPCKPGTPAPPSEHAGIAQFTFPGGRFQADCTTVKFLLEWSYGIQPSQHSGGPSWIDTDRYSIIAKAEGPATEDQMRLMVQAMLAERFQLKFHRETKELSAFVISLGKAAPKLFPPKEGETHSIQASPQRDAEQKVTVYRIVAARYSLTQLADAFSRQMDKVMLNETGLDGEFDFTLDLTPDFAQGEARPNFLEPTLLMTAMREQLGLTLKAQKAMVDFFAIDSAERVVGN